MQLGHELAPKVRVNGYAPGGTPTALGGLRATGTDTMHMEDVPNIAAMISGVTPLHVAATPADHASGYLFLSRRENVELITGTVIEADAGLAVRGLSQLAGLDAVDQA